MCGIVAAVAERNVLPLLIDGLRRLEYRGYDSAGVAYMDERGLLTRERAVGKVQALADCISDAAIGHIGMAHTRWATHGAPTVHNAHPQQSSNQIVLVHNGIIENEQALREQLQGHGYVFESETDTEAIAHVLHYWIDQGKSMRESLVLAQQQLQGAYSITILDVHQPDTIWGMRTGSPMVVGVGVGEHFIASDAAALVPLTQQMIYLHDGDIVQIRRAGVELFDANGESIQRPIQQSSLTAQSSERGDFRHFMLKEIHEQPDAITATLDGCVNGTDILPELPAELLKQTRHIHILACGTSYHAGLTARYWIESLTGIPVSVEIASEYRNREPAVPEQALMMAISQSGETADTLAALELASERNYLARIGICNVPESALTRACDYVLMTRAGLEIGVASTKAFTTQLTVLLLLATTLAKARDSASSVIAESLDAVGQVAQQAREVLAMEASIEEVAMQLADKQHALFLGRGAEFPIALEGALKLKEVSYIHAEGYAAGELKHGPLALVDDTLPVIVTASSNRLLKKLKSNLREVRARGGQLLVFADRAVTLDSSEGMRVIHLPVSHSIASPIVQILPLQLLAYHVGVLRGTDVDQPRNLAKSVTVE
ncbi:MAG: glutamine--fructose-6-phosphate transaminase (isomerizing) [Pseudomonadota bacterium]